MRKPAGSVIAIVNSEPLVTNRPKRCHQRTSPLADGEAGQEKVLLDFPERSVESP